MNNSTTTSSQRLTLISKNGGIHVGWVEEPQASPAPTQPTQLELNFNQSTTNNNEQPFTPLPIQQPPASTTTTSTNP